MSRQRDAVTLLASSTVGGAMAGDVLWWVVNGGVKTKGPNAMTSPGGPLQSVWVAVALGAAVGALIGAVRYALRRRRSEALSTLAAMTGMDYQDDASAFLDRHPGLRSMPLFADLTSGLAPGKFWFMPLLFFGSAAVGASAGLVAGVAISDRLARNRSRRARPDEPPP